MDPISLVIIILAVCAGAYAVYKGDGRAAGAGVLLLALLELLGMRG